MAPTTSGDQRKIIPFRRDRDGGYTGQAGTHTIRVAKDGPSEWIVLLDGRYLTGSAERTWKAAMRTAQQLAQEVSS